MSFMEGNKKEPKTALHIPLSEEEAIRLALRVKPTKDMPRPGAHPTGPKKKLARRKRNK
jgi:hypothetical protein